MRAWIFACLVLGATARADVTVHGDDAARAALLYKSAIAHYNIAEFREALQDFKGAYRLKPDPVLLFNIGQCYRLFGDPQSAARAYRAYLRERPEAPHRAMVEKLIAEADSRAALGSSPSPSPAPKR